jgi:hypothetical protein
VKKKTVSKAKKEAWTEFSRYIRLRDCLETTGTTTHGRCVTCGKTFEFSRLQAGHFIPGRTNAILFDERGVHAQCVGCNMFGRGMWPEYYQYMKEEYGEETIFELVALRRTVKKWTVSDLEEIRDLYRAKIDELFNGAA